MTAQTILPANTLSSGYDVANSLRFNDGSSDYLNRTCGAGSRQTWTLSMWVKRGTLVTDQSLFSTYVHANDEFKINFYDTDKVGMRFYNGSEFQLEPNRLFRDTSAWYHLVFVADTTNGTEGNRFRIYVNGTEETSFAAEDQPSQNLQMSINDSNVQQIGRKQTSAYFDGYMAEVVFIDGSALTAASFGEFDEDSPTIWKPKAVSGLTFGTNGFYLDFENSGNLGADASGESHNWTANNFTAIDQSTDTCTNNFATMNPLDNYRQAHAFSDGNLTVTTTNGSQSYSTSSILLTSGKWYVECKPVSGGSEPEIGIANKMVLLNAGNNAQVSYNANGYGYRASDPGTVWYNGEYVTNSLVTYANGDIIGIALDLDNNKLYFSKNGTFANSQDPTDGTNAVSIIDPASTEIGGYVFSCNETFNDQNKVFSWNFGSPPYAISSGNTDGNGHGNFEYAVPSGYLALCTKNLAENG